MSLAEDFLGTSLDGGYRIDRIVSETIDSFVFEGTSSDGAAVSIRMARAQRGASLDELTEAFANFAVEADQLSELTKASAHVEPLLGSGETTGPDRERLAYCVFAHVEGSSFADLRVRRPMSLGRAIARLEPIAAALAKAHEQGVFHGDVRPDNMILVGYTSGLVQAKLVRFTLATRLGQATHTFAAEYGAPEHFKRSRGASGVGPATDIYGLALTLIELVTGRPALEGNASELYKQTIDIAHRPTLSARGGNVSAALDAVIARAVAVNPKLRWQTAREFWPALLIAAAPDLADEPEGSAAEEESAAAAIPPPALPDGGPSVSARVGSIPDPGRFPSSGSRVGQSGRHAPAPPMRRLDEGIPPDSIPPARSRGGKAGWIVVLLAVLVLGGVAAVMLRDRLGATKESEPPHASSVVASASGPVGAASAPSAPPPPSAETKVDPPASAKPHASTPPPGMVRVPAGTFKMGKDTEGKGDRPAHRVTLTHAFYIDRTEVTAGAYGACIEDGACTSRIVHVRSNSTNAWGCNTERDRSKHPANCVDRGQATAYCTFMKKRLPTEAEWEYTARGTDERDYPWGSLPPTTCALAVLSGVAGACGERKGTSAVGIAPEGKSPFGALDMTGNVWEWVADDFASYPSEPVTDPAVTSEKTEGVRGIVRGGSWDYTIASAKVFYRLPVPPEAGNASVGFRCAVTAD